MHILKLIAVIENVVKVVYNILWQYNVRGVAELVVLNAK